MNNEYYINVRDLMVRQLPKPTRKRKLPIPIISVDVGLWSPVTW